MSSSSSPLCRRPCVVNDDREDSEASSDAVNLAVNSSDNETFAVTSSRPVAVVSRPAIDNVAKRRKLRLQLSEDEDIGGHQTKARSVECHVSSNETFADAETFHRPVAFINRPTNDNLTERRKLRSQLAEDESGSNGRIVDSPYDSNRRKNNSPQQQQQQQQKPRTATTSATLSDDEEEFDESIISTMMVQPTLENLPRPERMKIAFLQSSLFPLSQSIGVNEKEEVMEDVERGIAVADVAVEENDNLEVNDRNPADASIGESTVEGHEVLPMPVWVQSASIRPSDPIRSTPGAFSIQGINSVNEEGVNEEDDHLDYVGMGTGTTMAVANGFDEHGIMVEANVVDVAAEEAERAETLNLRKQTTSLRVQLEQLKNENTLLRDGEIRPGTSFMSYERIAAVVCPFLLLIVLMVLFLNNSFKFTSNKHIVNDVNDETPPPIAITFESPSTVPSSQPSFTIQSLMQQSIRPPPSTSPSMRPPIVPVEWESIGGDVFGNDPGDFFGYHVDISGNGNRIAVRTYDNTFQHVRLYELAATTTSTQSTWRQMGNDITNASDVVMDESGSTIAVGDHNSDTVTAYTWDASSNTWKQFGTVLSGHGSPTVLSLSSDGRQLAIGDAYSEKSPTGQVVVYKWNNAAGDWIPMGDAIVADNSFTRFGTSVSLSGDGSRMTVGAALVDSNQFAVGRIQVFEWNEQMSAWKQHGQIITGYELFGHDFEMSRDGTTIVVGASLSSQGGAYSGRAVVYRYDGRSNRWTQLGDELVSEVEDDRLGSSVSISKNGNRIAIGAYSTDSDDIGKDVGHVRVLDWNGSNWIQSGDVVTGDEVGGHFGWSVGLSNDGSRMVVGAVWHECPDDNNDWIATRCGLVRTFDAKPLHPVP